jgi:hypothetical protein
MSPQEEKKLTSADVLNRVRIEIEAPAIGHSENSFDDRMARIQALQHDFRVEPIGGRLPTIKRLMYWFIASAFDRQAKVVEALLDLIQDIGDEVAYLRAEVRRLQEELTNQRHGSEDDQEGGEH